MFPPPALTTNETQSAPRKLPHTPLTNAEKIASADHKRFLSQKQKSTLRPPSKKPKALPPPEEMEEEIRVAEERERDRKKKELKVKNGTQVKRTIMTNDEKIEEYKKKMMMKKKRVLDKKKGKGAVSFALGMEDLLKMKKMKKKSTHEEKSEEGKRSISGKVKEMEEEERGGVKTKKQKKQSAFSMVMEQGTQDSDARGGRGSFVDRGGGGEGEQESAFGGTGRVLGRGGAGELRDGELVVESIESYDEVMMEDRDAMVEDLEAEGSRGRGML